MFFSNGLFSSGFSIDNIFNLIFFQFQCPLGVWEFWKFSCFFLFDNMKHYHHKPSIPIQICVQMILHYIEWWHVHVQHVHVQEYRLHVFVLVEVANVEKGNLLGHRCWCAYVTVTWQVTKKTDATLKRNKKCRIEILELIALCGFKTESLRVEEVQFWNLEVRKCNLWGLDIVSISRGPILKLYFLS